MMLCIILGNTASKRTSSAKCNAVFRRRSLRRALGMKSPTSNTPRMAFGECHANNTKTANERKIPPDYRRGFSIHNLFTFYPAEGLDKSRCNVTS